MLLEFKSYTEVSMLKRVFMDAEIAKKFFPDASYSLCMLESALGSSDKNDKKKANQEIAYENHKFLISYSAITLIEYLETKLDVKVDMLFLMNGIRDSKRDIGKKKYLKKIDLKELKFTVNYFTTFFKAYKKN